MPKWQVIFAQTLTPDRSNRIRPLDYLPTQRLCSEGGFRVPALQACLLGLEVKYKGKVAVAINFIS